MYTWNYEFIEYLGLEGTHKDHRTIESKPLGLLRTFLKLNYMSQSVSP